MKLIDLNPKWILPSQWSDQSPPVYIGVSFDCPAHSKICPTCKHNSGHRLAFKFDPPIDEFDTLVKYQISLPTQADVHKRLSGTTFETLTIAPSVVIGECVHITLTNGELLGIG